MRNKELKRRIIEISYKKKLSHLGSCLTAVDIINDIYATKLKDEKFVLSSGHAGLALYVVNEAYFGIDAEDAFDHHGVHPDRCADHKLDCSSGSLGHGLGISIGMALADRTKTVYCLISDGECAEGSISEAFSIIAENKIDNLEVYLNLNGFSAYKTTDDMLMPFADETKVNIYSTNSEQLPFLKGLDAHYYTMNENDYKQAMEILK